jgi:diacylglycerol O-acyltransferase / wax synthase
MRQLTTLDAQFLAVESARTYGHVGTLAIYDPATAPGGEFGLDELTRLVAERLHLLPPLRWRLATVPLGLDLPYWIDDRDFDLTFHIRESAVPPPGDDHRLAETVARIFARPLDRSRPLWEIYVIHGLPDGQVALLTKIHHAVVDGVSGNEITTMLLDLHPEGRELPPAPAIASEPSPGELEMLARGVIGLGRQPLRAMRSLPTTLPNLTELPGVAVLPGGPMVARAVGRTRSAIMRRDPHVLEATTARAPKTIFNGPISPHRRYAFGQLPLDTVKRVKDALGLTVNDVVVALCASAVRQWLLDRDALPDEPLVAMIPVSVRTDEEKGTFGNRVSMMIVPIPTDEPDAGRRAHRTHELLRSAKEHHQALPADLLTDATAFIPPAVAARAARTTMQIIARTRPPLNLIISNVPGPREKLYLAGAELQAIYPVSVVTDGVGLNITVTSYRDHLYVGLIGDREQVDDLWSMLDGLRAALAELEAAADAAAKPRRRPSKRAT